MFKILRESIHWQVDKKSRGPQGERGLGFLRRQRSGILKEKDKPFSLYIPQSQSHKTFLIFKPDVSITKCRTPDIIQYSASKSHGTHVLIVLQSLSRVQFFATSLTTAHQAPLSSTVSLSLLKFMSTESEMLSNHLILYCLLLLQTSIERVNSQAG